jgi:FkbM family methyltransferase
VTRALLSSTAWRNLASRATRWHNDPETAELARIRAVPRYTPLVSDLWGFPLRIVDSASFYACFTDIFTNGIYAIDAETDEPCIIDAGANIGVGIIYFKQRFPSSRILAFEADPRIHAVLEHNVRAGGFDGVELINKALWTSEDGICFCPEGADGGRIARSVNETIDARIRIPTVRLRTFLDRPVDFLKVDIEGAEVEVLTDCGDSLRVVKNLFVEYHSFEAEEQQLDVLLSLLRRQGFRVYVQSVSCPPRPFLSVTSNLGMDLQLNIFATRPRDGAGTASRGNRPAPAEP